MTKSRRWAVVLAGGEGARMSPFVVKWLGAHRPKQYCAFSGERTMLEHAMDRALSVADAGRILTVIGRGHWKYLDEPRRQSVPGRIIEQPENRDTAPGIFFPLSYVLAADPEASIVILPSDHFVKPKRRFSMYVDRAFALTERLEDQIVLLAGAPDRAEPDYGWIEAGELVTASASWAKKVARFHEKPDEMQALEFFQRGFLWNTMVMIGKAKTFWAIAQRLHPRMMWKFEAFRAAIGGGGEASLLREIYREMEKVNFSRDILERSSANALVLPLFGVEWCDWGRPERIVETLRRDGKEPVFAAELLPA